MAAKICPRSSFGGAFKRDASQVITGDKQRRACSVSVAFWRGETKSLQGPRNLCVLTAFIIAVSIKHGRTQFVQSSDIIKIIMLFHA